VKIKREVKINILKSHSTELMISRELTRIRFLVIILFITYYKSSECSRDCTNYIDKWKSHLKKKESFSSLIFIFYLKFLCILINLLWIQEQGFKIKIFQIV
jgi:hypothetical protein